MLVLIFLRVVLIPKVSFMLEWDAGNLGVGTAAKNSVVNIMTRKQVKNYRQQKTIMMPYAVGKKKDLQKQVIVEEAAQATVAAAGNSGKGTPLDEEVCAELPVEAGSKPVPAAVGGLGRSCSN